MIKLHRKLRRDLDYEGGNTFVMYTMMFGLMAIFLGFAIDSGLNYYTKNGMQSSLDSAVVAAASNRTALDYNSSGKFVINKDKANSLVINAFNDSKVNYPNLVNCNEKSQCTKITTSVKNKSGRGQYLSVKATIYSKNVFLHMVDLPTQSYNLVSDARLGYIQDTR